jgi:molecular chaperone GrpE
VADNDQDMPDDGTSPDAASAPGPDGGKTPAPQDRVAALESEKVEMRDRMLRIAAEFENFKKRARREQTEGENKGKESVLRDMLEVLDNLERAVAAFGDNPDTKGVLQGVSLVLRLFQSKLERYEVRPMESKGQPFDPRIHDAISQIPSPDVAPGTIITELQKGYRIGERLLRPATVVVAVAPPAPPSANEKGNGASDIDIDIGDGGGDGAEKKGKED